MRARPDPARAPLVACSLREPVCVHGPPDIPPWSFAAALRHAEDALRIQRALGLPLPLPDGLLGGSSSFDLYLLPGAEPPAVSIDLDTLAGPFDQASAFAVLPPPEPNSGCVPRVRAAHAVADATWMRFDAGAEPGVVAMASSYVASLTAPCSVVEIPAIDAFQRAPERALTGAEPGSTDGSLLFPWYLDHAYGVGRPAAVIAGLLAVSVQRTRPGAFTFSNEPDTFDALRRAMKDRGAALDDLLIDFAVARAFVGDRSDEGHLIDVARFGDAGRVRFEWNVPYATLPRRLAPLTPIEPMGATYLWLDLEGAPASGAELTVVADWELDVLFRWALIKVDRSGREAGRVDVAGVFGSTHAERTVLGLDGLAGVLVVGVNAGSMDRARPFDPDEVPFVPRSYTVTLVK